MKTQITIVLCYCLSILGFGQSIDDIEYFFNTDPGFGQATSIAPDSNSGNLTQTLSIPTGSLTGFNSLYIRTQDNLGIWTMYEKRELYITDFIPLVGAAEIVSAEYFFNTDPGFGNGITLSVNANSGNVTQSYSIPLGSLTGFNSLYIRTLDDLGIWSLYEKRIFFVTDFTPLAGATNIADAEYFYNTDPGFGNGTPITVDANTGDLTQIISIPVNSLQGFNSLYIRTQDDLGVWSLYEKRIFFVEDDIVLTIPTLTGAEYFYDADPGFGNGTPTTITTTGNPDEFTVELGTTEVSCDFHDFYLRLQNSDGTWSLYDYSIDLEVFDNANPTIVVFPDITAELDANGEASITLADVNNGTFDDCELVSVVLNQAQFDYTCADLGINTVTVTATDAEDKVSNQDVDITVVDLINPVAIAQDITIQLDANGEATITGAQIDNGSTDNCSVDSFSLDVSSFNCSNLGNNTVTLTAIDQSGNNSTNAPTATVTVEDNINPTVNTQNITIQLDANGDASITANQIDNNSTDNCTIDSRSIDISTFTCADLGPNTVTLTVTDQSGNSENNTATVTVEDTVNPIVNTQNITVQLDANGNASITASEIDNNSTDNCTIDSRSIDISTFTCTDLGANTVTLTVTDQSGNSENDTATVTVEDTINPVAIGQDITIDINGNPSITITANDVNNGSYDNCGFVLSIDVDTFTQEGVFPVVLTATDVFGNEHSTTVMVTVEDSTLGLEDLTISPKNIKLYPVPVNNQLFISTKLIIDIIDIYDINGKHIKTINNPNLSIQTNDLSSGVYFIKFKIENSFVTKRIIKE
ncbi:T9SS type A sorting domain-containing protein [Pontimicrobium sp. IMCC45349]|uniref:T9SS type A sorting domain-containing protein n=1 Tax=Pontimicrobium sp. IMCC45349 TaxID=3391574 RepID=UPI00399F5969